MRPQIVGHIVIAAVVGQLHIVGRLSKSAAILGVAVFGITARGLGCVFCFERGHLLKGVVYLLLKFGAGHLKHTHITHLQPRQTLLQALCLGDV